MDFEESYAMNDYMRSILIPIPRLLKGISRASVVIGVGMAFSHLAAAQDLYLPDRDSETPLNAPEVKALFSGKVHRGSYNFLMQNFSGVDFEEHTKADGTLVHTMSSRTDTGRWTIKGPQICFDYDSTDLLPACFSFYQRGNCIYHFQETVQGRAAPRFTAVSVLKGEEPSCDPPMS
jgi:hypothetical protein